MTIIGFVRHGETDWNREGRAQGQFDVPLNSRGIRQAELLAARLAGSHWDLIYASDLLRARKTAEIIARAIGHNGYRTDQRLREKSHGRLDGTTEAERIAKWGEGWRELDHAEEKLESVRARSTEFIAEAVARHAGRKLLIVSHGALIRTTLRALLPELAIEPLQNTSLTIVKRTAAAWECALFNCSRHLAENPLIRE